MHLDSSKYLAILMIRHIRFVISKCYLCPVLYSLKDIIDHNQHTIQTFTTFMWFALNSLTFEKWI